MKEEYKTPCGKDIKDCGRHKYHCANPLAGFLQEALKNKVQHESWLEYWAKFKKPPLPKYSKPKIAKLSAGVYNIVRQLLP